MLLEGKKIAIFNVANKRSIAWAIAQAMDAQGAELILGYQNERMAQNLEKIVGDLSKPPVAVVQCDVTSNEEIEAAADKIKATVGSIDGLVHALAFAPREALESPFVQTTREAFAQALDISAYSLVALCRALQPMLNENASVMALSYYGAEKVVPNYNVMGVAKAALEASVRYLAADLGQNQVRVNAISAGPLNTLAARGISGFIDMMKIHSDRAALRRNIEPEEVAGTAVFLASGLSTGITGEIMYVDAGYSIMGM